LTRQSFKFTGPQAEGIARGAEKSLDRRFGGLSNPMRQVVRSANVLPRRGADQRTVVGAKAVLVAAAPFLLFGAARHQLSLYQ
jgi:hypothetical protein